MRGCRTMIWNGVNSAGRKQRSHKRLLMTTSLATLMTANLAYAQQAPTIGIQSMMKEIVAAGGDTDTNCSIAGQIAGVAMGSEAIPEDWMKKLRTTPKYDEFYETMRKFGAFVSSQSGIQTLF